MPFILEMTKKKQISAKSNVSDKKWCFRVGRTNRNNYRGIPEVIKIVQMKM